MEDDFFEIWGVNSEGSAGRFTGIDDGIEGGMPCGSNDRSE
jgi:hypothetical protein